MEQAIPQGLLKELEKNQNQYNEIIQIIDFVENNISIIKDVIDQVKKTNIPVMFHKIDCSIIYENNNKVILVNLKMIDNLSHSFKINFNENIYSYMTILYEKRSKYESNLEKIKNIMTKEQKKQQTPQVKKDKEDERKMDWYEYFNWFISSDNLLVVCGKNAKQNEKLFNSFTHPTDIYLHGNFNGSGSCIVKNPDNKNVSEIKNTLDEANDFLICHTRFWYIELNGQKPTSFWSYISDVKHVSGGTFMIQQKNILRKPSYDMCLIVMYMNYDRFEYFVSDKTQYAVLMCVPSQTVINQNIKKLRFSYGKEVFDKKNYDFIINKFIDDKNEKFISDITFHQMQRVIINNFLFN